MALVVNSNYDFDDVMAVRELWQGFPTKKLAKESLLDVRTTCNILRRYDLKSDDFNDTAFIRELKKDFKDIPTPEITKCVRIAAEGSGKFTDQIRLSNRKIKRKNASLINKMTTYLLLENGMTGSELAKKKNVGMATIHNWRTSTTNDNLASLERFKKLLKLDEDDYQELLNKIVKWDIVDLDALFAGLDFDVSFFKFVIDVLFERYKCKSAAALAKKNGFGITEHKVRYVQNTEKDLTLHESERIREMFKYDLNEWIDLIKEFEKKQFTYKGRYEVKLLIRCYKEIYRGS